MEPLSTTGIPIGRIGGYLQVFYQNDFSCLIVQVPGKPILYEPIWYAASRIENSVVNGMVSKCKLLGT